MYLQGDGNIRYYEITTEKPYLMYLMEFRSPAPQKGLGKCYTDVNGVLIVVCIILDSVQKTIQEPFPFCNKTKCIL